MEGVISVVNNAQNLPADTKTPLSSVLLPKQTLIEIDAWPPSTKERQKLEGHLPPAMAITSFEFDDLDAPSVPFITPPQPREEAPYYGARAATLIGATGELMELIETRAK